MNGIASLGRMGVIANPTAGTGLDTARVVLLRVFEALRGADLVLNEGTLEARVASDCGLRCAPAHGAAGDARRLTEALLAAGVDTIVGVGGDGTLADIGATLVARRAAARLLGIGIGSSNVGPLVAAPAAEVAALLAGPWREVAVHALDVRVDGELVGIAFHDATPANTYFGTRDGRRLDLAAAAALAGRDEAGRPQSVCTSTTWVGKNGVRRLDGLAGGQVVASPLNDMERCRGLAVSGLLCWGPFVGCYGVVTVASTVMIRTQLVRQDLELAEPLRLSQLGVAAGDVVDAGGFGEGAAIVVDGTPRAALGPDAVASFRVLERAVTVLRQAPRSTERDQGSR